MALWVECSPMDRKTGILSRVESYQKLVLDTSLLNTQHYKVLSRVKWSNPGKGVVPSPTHRCSSHRKGSLRVALDYSRQLTTIHSKRLLTNKIKIQSLLTKNPVLTQEIRIFICWLSFSSTRYWCYYMIQYSIYNNFSIFCKNVNCETESII